MKVFNTCMSFMLAVAIESVTGEASPSHMYWNHRTSLPAISIDEEQPYP